MTHTSDPRWVAKFRLAGEPKTQTAFVLAEHADDMSKAVDIVRQHLWHFRKKAPHFFSIEELV